MLAALQRDFARLRTLEHPHIARMVELGCNGQQYYVTGERLDGEPLREVLNHLLPERLDVGEADDIVRAIGSALVYAHERGLAHGAVRAENVLITMDRRVVLTNFLARRVAKVAARPPRPSRRPEGTCAARGRALCRLDVARRSAHRRSRRDPRQAVERDPRRARPGEPAHERRRFPRRRRPANPRPRSPRASARKNRSAPGRSGGSYCRWPRSPCSAPSSRPTTAASAPLPRSSRSAASTRYAPSRLASPPAASRRRAAQSGRLESADVRSSPASAAPPQRRSRADARRRDAARGGSAGRGATALAAPAAPGTPGATTAATSRPRPDPAVLSLGTSRIAAREDHSVVAIDIVRSGDTTSEAAVGWWTTPDTAHEEDDYAGIGRQTVTFPAGATVERVLIPIVNDGVRESDEVFTVHLSRPRGGVAGAVTATRVTLHDDD